MTTRNLSALFAPKAIALLGASNETGSVGNVLMRNLLGAGFSGSVTPVNPKASDVLGVRAYASVNDLPETPDLAVIATPPQTLPKLIAELGARGCRAAVVITAGLDKSQLAAMLTAGRPYLIRIVGPNCLGFLSPISGINASFAHRTPPKGRLAFLTQSGAIATSIIDWAIGRQVGFSHIVSLGDMSDVDFGDLLDFLATDRDTSAILMYAENITHARKFMSAGRIAARVKPVIVVKGGRSKVGALAAASHTGAMAGADIVYDAAFRRAGMLRVSTLRELFDAAETLSSGLHVEGNRLTIITNGGGLGVLAADALELGGGHLAALSDTTKAKLDSVLPRNWSRSNPIDLIGDAQGSRYLAALDVVLQDDNSNAVLVMNCPTGVADSVDAARATVQAHETHRARPLIGCWIGEATTAKPRDMLRRAGIPNYDTPDEAVSAFLHLAEYARNQKALFETPSADLRRAADRKSDARSVIAKVISEGREILTEPEAKAVLTAYNIPVAETRIVRTPDEAANAAQRIGGPVALKILSRQITHKSDVGGVALDLVGAEATRMAADSMLERIARARPDAVIDGFTVQQMIKRPHAQELLLGAMVDPTFGPCVMFGQGGVATEVIADRCIGFPPLSENLAREMISRTRVARLLAGYRDRKPADLSAIASTIVALSNLIIDINEIAELDINPLLADEGGVIALDARIIVRAGQRQLLAIKPYPADLAHQLMAEPRIWLRPIKPEDSTRLADMAQRSRPEDLRLRFHGGIGAAAEGMAVRLSQIDYDREMAFVAELTDGAFAGVVRLVFEPSFDSAETAIFVRSDLQQRGIGEALLRDAIRYAGTRGATTVWGDILADNDKAFELGKNLQAHAARSPQDPSLLRLTFVPPGIVQHKVLSGAVDDSGE